MEIKEIMKLNKKQKIIIDYFLSNNNVFKKFLNFYYTGDNHVFGKYLSKTFYIDFPKQKKLV